MRDCQWQSWYNNGKLKDEGTFKDALSVGLWQGWYSNGKQNYKGEFNAEGKKQGLWEFWYDNGQYREKGSYVSSIKHGHWTTYFEKGNFIDSDGNYSSHAQAGQGHSS